MTGRREADPTPRPSGEHAARPARAARSLSRVALRNGLSAVFTRTSSLVVSVLLTPIVLAGLGRELYGVSQVVNSLYEYISLIRGGLSAALRRYVTLHHHGGRAEEASLYFAVGFWWSGVLRTAILLVGWAAAASIANFLRLPEALHRDATFGIALIILATVIADAGAIFEIPVFATGRTERISLIRAAAAWARLGVTVLLFRIFRPSLPLYGLTLIVVEALPLLATIPVAMRTGVVRSLFPRWIRGTEAVRRDLFSYGRLALLSQTAALLYTTADNVLIGRIYGAAAVTTYSLGTRWSILIRGFLHSSVTSLVPLFTQLEAQGESERTRSALLEVVKLTTAVAVPCCLVPCFIGDIFLAHWVGSEYRSSYIYMLAMLAPLTIDVAFMPVWMAMTARGRIGWIATGDLMVAVGNVTLSLILALGFKLGLLGFALGNTVASLAKQLILRPLAARRDPSFPRPGEYGRALPRAFLGGAPGLFLIYLARPLCERGMLTLLLVSGVGSVITLTGSLLGALGPSGIRQTMARIRRR